MNAARAVAATGPILHPISGGAGASAVDASRA